MFSIHFGQHACCKSDKVSSYNFKFLLSLLKLTEFSPCDSLDSGHQHYRQDIS